MKNNPPKKLLNISYSLYFNVKLMPKKSKIFIAFLIFFLIELKYLIIVKVIISISKLFK